jgi:hypothetical protein
MTEKQPGRLNLHDVLKGVLDDTLPRHPVIVETQHRPVDSLSAMHEIMVGFAERVFAAHETVPQTWGIADPASVILMVTQHLDRDAVARGMRNLVANVRARFYSLVTEAWTASIDRDQLGDERFEAMVEFAERFGVAALPAAMRDDVLVVQSFARDEPSLTSRWLVNTRRPKGPNFLGPRVDETPDGGTTGRFGDNFFNPPHEEI